MKSIKFLCILSLFLCSSIFSQTESKGTIKGKIVDSKTQESLPSATIQIEGIEKGAFSDLEGNFVIPNLSAGTYEITFSFIGYKSTTKTNVVLKSGNTLNLGKVGLQESALTLSEVVVTPGSFTVLSKATPASRQTLTERDIKNMSWAEDITRVVARLPGIAANDFSSKFTIRGGEADEVMINLDGMELYDPFHQKDFVGGLFSIVDVETIEGIDLYTGGFSADYGNRQSGVFNMRTKKVRNGERKTSVGLSIMNARFYTQGAFAKEKGSYLISVRRGMLDQIAKAVGFDEIIPTYYDALGKVEYQMDSKNAVTFHTLHAGDQTKVRDESDGNFDRNDTEYGNTYFWGTWKNTYNNKLFSRTILSTGLLTHKRVGAFHKYEFADKGDFSVSDKRNYNFFGLRQDWNWSPTKNFLLKTGFELKKQNADYKYHFFISELRVNQNDELYQYEDKVDIETKPSGEQANFYLSSRFKVLPKLFMEAGLRYDYASYTNDKLLSPRLSLAYSFGRNTYLRGAWGYYYQTQFMNDLEVNYGKDTFNKAELAKHYVLSFEHTFDKGINFRAEAYRKDLSRINPTYRNLRDPMEMFLEQRNDLVKININSALAQGIEVFLKYDMGKKISWWFSYALAKAEDDIQSIEYDGQVTERTGKVPRLNNQRHTVFADLNYRPNAKWHFNLSWQYYTGWPRTNYHYEHKFLQGSPGASVDSLHFYAVHEVYNDTDYPAYQRMDLRINRHFQFNKSRLSAFLHVINVYNHENLRKFDLDVLGDDELPVPDGEGGFRYFRDDTLYFGLTPIIGLSWEF
ncbi:MAG: TonB-dependent receptor [Calditrichaeota bacterium]|nr:MAG: TonB-dependent receptor [Calditrichota bacterium]